MVNRHAELIRTIPLFASLASAEQAAIARFARIKRYAAQQVAFRQGDEGDYMFAVASGHMKVTITGESDGAELLLSILRPGDVCGELAVLDGERRSATVTALDLVEVLVVDRSPFLAFLRSSPDAAIELLRVVAQRVRRLTDEHEATLSLDVSARLGAKLAYLARRCGRRDPAGHIRIAVRVSQHELGSWVGATRESVNKFLARCRQRGILRLEGRHMVIADMKRLELLARGALPDRGDEPPDTPSSDL